MIAYARTQQRETLILTHRERERERDQKIKLYQKTVRFSFFLDDKILKIKQPILNF
jgi:hypothetical protein